MFWDDIPKTAIILPFCLFEFVRMPFGLHSTGSMFQRRMDHILAGLPFIFVDDVLVAKTDHTSHKQLMPQCLCLPSTPPLITSALCWTSTPPLITSALCWMAGSSSFSPTTSPNYALGRLSAPWSARQQQLLTYVSEFTHVI